MSSPLSELDDLSSGSDEEFFDVQPIPGFFSIAGLTPKENPSATGKSQISTLPPNLNPPKHSQSLSAIYKKRPPHSMKMGNAQQIGSTASGLQTAASGSPSAVAAAAANSHQDFPVAKPPYKKYPAPPPPSSREASFISNNSLSSRSSIDGSFLSISTDTSGYNNEVPSPTRKKAQRIPSFKKYPAPQPPINGKDLNVPGSGSSSLNRVSSESHDRLQQDVKRSGSPFVSSTSNIPANVCSSDKNSVTSEETKSPNKRGGVKVNTEQKSKGLPDKSPPGSNSESKITQLNKSSTKESAKNGLEKHEEQMENNSKKNPNLVKEVLPLELKTNVKELKVKFSEPPPPQNEPSQQQLAKSNGIEVGGGGGGGDSSTNNKKHNKADSKQQDNAFKDDEGKIASNIDDGVSSSATAAANSNFKTGPKRSKSGKLAALANKFEADERANDNNKPKLQSAHKISKAASANKISGLASKFGGDSKAGTTGVSFLQSIGLESKTNNKSDTIFSIPMIPESAAVPVIGGINVSKFGSLANFSKPVGYSTRKKSKELIEHETNTIPEEKEDGCNDKKTIENNITKKKEAKNIIINESFQKDNSDCPDPVATSSQTKQKREEKLPSKKEAKKQKREKNALETSVKEKLGNNSDSERTSDAPILEQSSLLPLQLNHIPPTSAAGESSCATTASTTILKEDLIVSKGTSVSSDSLQQIDLPLNHTQDRDGSLQTLLPGVQETEKLAIQKEELVISKETSNSCASLQQGDSSLNHTQEKDSCLHKSPNLQEREKLSEEKANVTNSLVDKDNFCPEQPPCLIKQPPTPEPLSNVVSEAVTVNSETNLHQSSILSHNNCLSESSQQREQSSELSKMPPTQNQTGTLQQTCMDGVSELSTLSDRQTPCASVVNELPQSLLGEPSTDLPTSPNGAPSQLSSSGDNVNNLIQLSSLSEKGKSSCVSEVKLEKTEALEERSVDSLKRLCSQAKANFELSFPSENKNVLNIESVLDVKETAEILPKSIVNIENNLPQTSQRQQLTSLETGKQHPQTSGVVKVESLKALCLQAEMKLASLPSENGSILNLPQKLDMKNMTKASHEFVENIFNDIPQLPLQEEGVRPETKCVSLQQPLDEQNCVDSLKAQQYLQAGAMALPTEKTTLPLVSTPENAAAIESQLSQSVVSGVDQDCSQASLILKKIKDALQLPFSFKDSGYLISSKNETQSLSSNTNFTAAPVNYQNEKSKDGMFIPRVEVVQESPRSPEYHSVPESASVSSMSSEDLIFKEPTYLSSGNSGSYVSAKCNSDENIPVSCRAKTKFRRRREVSMPAEVLNVSEILREAEERLSKALQGKDRKIKSKEKEVFIDAYDPSQFDILMPLPGTENNNNGLGDFRSRSSTPFSDNMEVFPTVIRGVVKQTEAMLSETDRILRKSRSQYSLRRSFTRSLSGANINRLTEVSADLSEEHNTAHLAGERIEAEQAERMKLEKEISQLQLDVKRMTNTNDKLEMEKLSLRNEVLQHAELNGDIHDLDESSDVSLYKRKYEWCLREMEVVKKQLKQQQEDDLDQLLILKKQLEKKISDAYEETDEQRQVVAQLKKKSQRLTAEMNDLKILLEEQTSRNNLLEKKQRKFDQDIQSVQEEQKNERLAKEKIQREKDQILSEKYSFEQEVSTLRLELELKEEKVATLTREIEDLNFTGKAEEEVALLKKAKHDLELRVKDQEEELDDLAGQVQMLESAKIKLQMSIEQMRKENRKEMQQREEEVEEIRVTAQKKIKALELQLETEHEERTQHVREKHDLERKLVDAQERSYSTVDEDAFHRVKKELKKTKALLKDTQTMLEKTQSEGSNKLLLRQLKTQLEDAEFAKTAAIKARQSAESDLSEIQNQLEEAHRAKKDCEDKCGRISKEKADMQTQLEESEEEMAEVMKKYKASVSQLSIDQINISEQSQLIADLEHDKQVLQERLTELSSKVEVLEGETANIHTQRRLQMKIKELESKLELELTTRQRLESQITRLKDQIDRISSDCDSAHSKENQAVDYGKKLSRQLREAKDDLSNFQQKCTDALNRKQEMEKQYELAESEILTLKSDLKLAFKRIEDLQQALQGDLSDSDSEMSDSKADIIGSPGSEIMSVINEDIEDEYKESFA